MPGKPPFCYAIDKFVSLKSCYSSQYPVSWKYLPQCGTN
nr:MAG TPA: hypothetical protein [Caudoviricetes sp.]